MFADTYWNLREVKTVFLTNKQSISNFTEIRLLVPRLLYMCRLAARLWL